MPYEIIECSLCNLHVDQCMEKPSRGLKRRITQEEHGCVSNKFVRPRLVKVQQNEPDSLTLGESDRHYMQQDETEKEEDVDPREIVSSDDKLLKTLIEGQAGIGKTALRRWAVNEWANDRLGMNYKMVFLFDIESLLKVTSPMTLTELLLKHSIFKKSRSHPQFKGWMENTNAERILLWFGKLP